MLSHLHEGLVSLFREHPRLAPDLLVEALRAELPEYSKARVLWVLHPANIPEILSSKQAKRHPELAVLSAVAHGQDTDIKKSAQIALAAQRATERLDAEHRTLYLDLILTYLSEAARRRLQDMAPGKYNYASDFARTYFGQGEAVGRAAGKAEGKAEGKEEGRIEGRAETVLRQLELRFGALSEAAQLSVRRAHIAELDAVAERLLSAGTLGEALGAGLGDASGDASGAALGGALGKTPGELGDVSAETLVRADMSRAEV